MSSVASVGSPSYGQRATGDGDGLGEGVGDGVGEGVGDAVGEVIGDGVTNGDGEAVGANIPLAARPPTTTAERMITPAKTAHARGECTKEAARDGMGAW